MRNIAPATLGGQGPNLSLSRTDNSTNPTEVKVLNPNKPRTINYLKALQVNLREVLVC